MSDAKAAHTLAGFSPMSEDRILRAQAGVRRNNSWRNGASIPQRNNPANAQAPMRLTLSAKYGAGGSVFVSQAIAVAIGSSHAASFNGA